MDEERVQYSFTGDVASLRDATKEAISLLDKYEGTIKKLAASDQFSVSKTTFTSFQRTINGLIKQVNSLASIVDSASVDVQQAMAPDTANVKRAVADVSDALDYLRGSAKLTSGDVKFLTTYLKDARTTFDLVSGRARALGTSFAQVAHMKDSFDPMTAKMQSFEDKASTTVMRVDEISDSFRRMTSSLVPAEDAWEDIDHEAIREQLKRLYAQMNPEINAIGREDKALRSKSGTLRESTNLHKSLTSALSKLGIKLKSEVSKVVKFTKSLDKTKQIAHALVRAFRTLVVSKLGQWFSKAVQSSIDLYENFNLFKVAMGETVDEGKAFVDQMAEIYGMDPSTLYKNIGYFYQLTDAIGMSEKASSTLSLSLTKASNDIASLFNVKVQTVVDDLASGMQGMARSVRKYGMDIRATTLEQTAMSLGIYEQVENMSEANRQALRYITMMHQVKSATSQVVREVDGSTAKMGDFARTIEQPANQLRIMGEQLTQLGRAMGDFFVKRLEKVLPLLNGMIMSLRVVITYIATLAGVFNDLSSESSNVETGSDALDSITESATDAAAALEKVTAPFDELNTLTKETAAGDDILDPKLQEIIENMSLGLDNVRMKANDIRDKILEFFGFKVENGEIVSWSREVFEQGLAELENSIPQLAKDLAKKINKIVNKMDAKKMGKNFGKVLNTLINTGVSFISELDTQALGTKITNFITTSLGEINFKNLGALCAAKFKIGTDLLIGIVDAMSEQTAGSQYGDSWTKFGANIAEWLSGALGSIDWSKLGKATNDLVIGLFKMIITAVAHTDWEQVGEDIADFLNALDLSGIFNSLLKLATSMFDAVGKAFDSLWKNADPETKSALTAAGLVLLGLTISKVIKLVNNLTGAFGNKNKALEKQTGLESAAATALSKNLQPALIGTTALAFGAAGAFGNLNINLGNLNPEPAKQFSTEVSGALAGVESTATNAANALDNLNENAGALEVKPIGSNVITSVNNFSTAVDNLSTSYENLGTSVSGALTKVNNKLKPLVGTLDKVPASLEKYKKVLDGLESVPEDATSKQSNKAASSGAMKAVTTVGAGIAISEIGAKIWAALSAAGTSVANAVSGFWGFMNTDITKLYFNQSPHMATGGVVTGPTRALIGEGRYDEAVIPLGNSPQMRSLVSEIADEVSRRDRGDDRPIEVKLYIGGREWDAFTYESSQRGKDLVGAQPIRIGG